MLWGEQDVVRQSRSQLSSSVCPITAPSPRFLIYLGGMITVKMHLLAFMEYLLFQMLWGINSNLSS